MINVILLGVVYILMGMGFAFILNLLGIFNLAHGAIFMSSSYGCYLLVVKPALPGFVAFPLTVLVAAAFGVLVEKFLFRPMKADFNRTMMVCIALSTILVTTFNPSWAPRSSPSPPSSKARPASAPTGSRPTGSWPSVSAS